MAGDIEGESSRGNRHRSGGPATGSRRLRMLPAKRAGRCRSEVGEATVRRDVAEVRCRLEMPLSEVMVPQHHPLGEEAEVDFGTISVYLAGVLVEVSMFVKRLSASSRSYRGRT